MFVDGVLSPMASPLVLRAARASLASLPANECYLLDTGAHFARLWRAVEGRLAKLWFAGSLIERRSSDPSGGAAADADAVAERFLSIGSQRNGPAGSEGNDKDGDDKRSSDVRYDRTMAYGLGHLRKDMPEIFGRDAESDSTPALGVFEFLRRFVKAGDDNDVSKGRALNHLPEFTKGYLKNDFYTIMPSIQEGRSREVSSDLELITWLLRKYAHEQSLSDQDAFFMGPPKRWRKQRENTPCAFGGYVACVGISTRKDN